MVSIDEILRKLNKDFKVGEIKLGMDIAKPDKIPFSSPRMNYLTNGGIPCGRITEFSGKESSGKTTTSLDIIANAQQKFEDKFVVFVDVERTFDPQWANLLNVDVEKLIYYNCETQSAEEILQTIQEISDCDNISLIVLDSIAFMVSNQENEKDIADRTYGGISMPLTRFSKKVTPRLATNNIALIAINQVRDDLNSSFGGTTTPGGKAWKHSCTLRMQFRQGEYIDEKGNGISKSCENPVGNIVNVAIEKNKLDGMQRKIGFYTLHYKIGIDYITDFIDVAVKHDLIIQTGAWFTIPTITDEKFQGKSKIKQYLHENMDIYNNLLSKLGEHD